MVRKKSIVNNINYPQIAFAIAFMFIGSLITYSAFAAKGGAGGGKGSGVKNNYDSSIEVTLIDDKNGDTTINHGDTITFKIVTEATDEPHLELLCYQNDTMVYSASTGYYAGYTWQWTNNMTLASQSWTSGGADCSARAYYYGARNKQPTLAMLNFTVKE